MSAGRRTVVKGAKHWHFGKTISPQTKDKQSKAKIGSKHPKFKGYYLYEDQYFESCQELADHLGVYPMKIHRMVIKGIISLVDRPF